MCDNFSDIYLKKPLMHHCRAKHINTKHHFIRDHILNSDIELSFLQNPCSKKSENLLALFQELFKN